MRNLTSEELRILDIALDRITPENITHDNSMALDDEGKSYREAWDPHVTKWNLLGQLWKATNEITTPYMQNTRIVYNIVIALDEILMLKYPNQGLYNGGGEGKPTLLACEKFGILQVRDDIREYYPDIPESNEPIII